MADRDTLVYFEVLRGRAEPARLLYTMADKEYADKRVTAEEWATMKEDQPLKQLPVLETAEGVLCQSNVIARYVAKKFGLMGHTTWEETLHDLVVEVCMEATQDIPAKIYYWKLMKKFPEPENSEKVVADIKESMIQKLRYIQSLSEERGTKYIVSDQMGLADAWLYVTLEFSRRAFPDIMEITPWVKQFTENFQSDERIQKHFASRPATEYDI